ncbi:SurA N-terminal domain-containing protein [Crenobacter sp. SG2303]|uniref:Periplasmic chaperone PpiD n=1 Tax=Crenobacter oryzisoli TaxID=3056844 RepID=A0ABT7XU23_9NEIS|nr:SurA N-terminal domain-containing protein [Crenobacter sp. SG2303]MDN0077230.1 SurA N-terminal domain-containing protein [Crenobacter sp. SG2303]
MFDFVQNNSVAIKVILGAVALTFVGFGVSSYSSITDDPYLAKVDGTKIYKKDLDRALEGQPADAATRQAALDNLIRQDLLLTDAKHAGLVASTDQVRRAIAAIPALQENGQFSASRYKDFLQARYMTPEAFEAQIAREVLLQGQISTFVAGQFVSHTQVDSLAKLLGEQRTVQVAVLQPQSVAADLKLDDATLKAYYNANAKRFRAPEAIKLQYVMLSQAALADTISVSDAEAQKFFNEHSADFGKEERRVSHILLTVPQNATAAQKAQIKTQAEAILKQVRANPAKFVEIAKARSQDPGSAANGGDLGFFGRGVMVKQFDDVAFNMKPGQISEVVETQFGYHILKLDDVKTPDFATAKDAVINRLKQTKAGALFRQQADQLNELAYQNGDSLQALVDKLKLKPETSDWLSRGKASSNPRLANPKVLDAAFSDDVLKKKHNSEPIDIGNNTLLVVRIAEHQPEHQLTLDEVKPQVRNELIARDGAKLVEKRGQTALAELQKGGSPVLAWSAAHQVSRNNLAGLPLSDARSVFSLSGAKLPAYAGVKHDNGDYIIYRVNAVTAAPAPSGAERAQLNNALGEVSANAQLSAYLQTLREEYKVTMPRQAQAVDQQ